MEDDVLIPTDMWVWITIAPSGLFLTLSPESRNVVPPEFWVTLPHLPRRQATRDYKDCSSIERK
jgi:hypothetical protein